MPNHCPSGIRTPKQDNCGPRFLSSKSGEHRCLKLKERQLDGGRTLGPTREPVPSTEFLIPSPPCKWLDWGVIRSDTHPHQLLSTDSCCEIFYHTNPDTPIQSFQHWRLKPHHGTITLSIAPNQHNGVMPPRTGCLDKFVGVPLRESADCHTARTLYLNTVNNKAAITATLTFSL